MDRKAVGIVLALTLGLSALCAPGGAAAAEPKPPKSAAGAARPDARRLGEVTILGTPEHPGVLFFLPKARFRLLPPRGEADWRERVLRKEAAKGDIP